MSLIDDAKARFDEISKYAIDNFEHIKSEEDARYQIISRILREVFRWPDHLVENEPHVDKGYIDYLIRDDEISLAVVEAKKLDVLLVDSKNPKMQAYKISGVALKSAASAIKQAESYAYATGAPLCVITNGFEWIVHWLIRGDGRNTADYKAITFPNLEAISESFAVFHDLLAYDALKRKTFKSHFVEVEGSRFALAENLRPIRDEKAPKLLPKTMMARDLDTIFKSFFSSMAGENDPEMLAYCFVETKESKSADAGLEKIARNILGSIQMVSNDSANGLEREIKYAVDTNAKEFVLIIGNKGAGKSTFIDRFFRFGLHKSIREKCLLFRVDLKDSDGNPERIQNWLDSKLVEEAERGLFGDKILSYEDLQGVFHKNYQQWAQGEFAPLYKSDKAAFKIKFGEFVHNIRENDKRRYLTALLWHATGARQLMPCLVFDNTDHYPQTFQEAVFVYAQAIHRGSFSFVICPITDRTIWQLSKSGPLQSYDVKAFYLPIPSTKDILERRLQFINSKTAIPSAQNQQYFLKKGIRLSVADINAFAACVEGIFVETEYVSRTVSWLCNHDIRRSLVLTQKVLSSPHISIDDLVKTFISGRKLRIMEHAIRKAIFLGDYDKFQQDQSEFVLNMFSVSSRDITSPLIRLTILQLLKEKEATKEDSEQAYIEVSEIHAFLDSLGVNFHAAQGHLETLAKFRCIEPYDPTEQTIQENTRLKITHSGLIHMEFCLDDPTYMEHVGLSSDVRESSEIDQVRQKVRDAHWGVSEWQFATNRFACYCVKQDLLLCNLAENLNGQKQMRHNFCWRWGVTSEQVNSSLQ